MLLRSYTKTHFHLLSLTSPLFARASIFENKSIVLHSLFSWPIVQIHRTADITHDYCTPLSLFSLWKQHKTIVTRTDHTYGTMVHTLLTRDLQARVLQRWYIFVHYKLRRDSYGEYRDFIREMNCDARTNATDNE